MTDLVITRIFDAPRELVYRAFTDPDQLSAWFGPVGWSVPRDSVDIDLRVGGHQRFTMVNEADPSMKSPQNATFVEVVENELLVGEESVAHIPDFGAEVLRLRIEFHDEEDGRTRVVLTQSPFPEAMADSARGGWGSSFTKLDKLLS
ncbi:SRPBCC domain-containing protein [Actinoplanes sp. NPDC051861]|uniref:SRPBCC family protein n=1 Tax=Actinoplanes sp. NPDC051861 TaxID=3155170 RepID=UPI00343AEE53